LAPILPQALAIFPAGVLFFQAFLFIDLACDHEALKRGKDRLAFGQTEPNILISGGSDATSLRGNLHLSNFAPTGLAFQLDPPFHRAALSFP
jgi:hypothetical protein